MSDAALDRMMFEAIEQCRPDDVIALTEQGANPNAKDSNGRSALEWALLVALAEGAKMFLEPPLEMPEDDEEPIVLRWVEVRDVIDNMVHFLVSKGLDWDPTQSNNLYLIGRPVESRVARVLLESGEITKENYVNWRWPVATEAARTVAFLMTYYPDPAEEFVLTCKYREPIIAKLMLQVGANSNSRGKDEWTALQAAADNGDIGMAYMLLEAGADVNFRGNMEYPPLLNAAMMGHVLMVCLLLEKGADPNAVVSGNSLLMYACQSQDCTPDVVKYLIKYGADPKATNGDGDTCLMSVAHTGNTEIAKLFLDAGVDPNPTGSGQGPLHRASWYGYHDFVQLLLAAGANPDVRDQYGETPLLIARSEGHSEVVRLMEAWCKK